MDDPDANFRLFRVGYQNLVFGDIRRAVFLVRAPVRQQRQGLCERQLYVEGEDATAQRELDLNGNGNYSYRYMLLKSFDDMLAGRYPDLQQAFRMLDEEGWDRVAVSHNFAVGKDRDINALRFVLYRGRKVGVALERPLAFLIDKDNEYLAEALQETGIKFKVNDV